MGQLIKLQDYISRYEQDIFLYPSRYVRLKKQRWAQLFDAWENNDGRFFGPEPGQAEDDWKLEEKQPLSEKIKGIFSLKRKSEEAEQLPVPEKAVEEKLDFDPQFASRPDTADELKQQFLDQLFKFQMKWASSTIMEKSFVQRSFFYDPELRFLLQRFPDTYLLLYKPVFRLKKAPVEAESVFITPTGAYCLSFMEEDEQAVFIGSKEHFWLKRTGKEEKKILNPLIALDRTEKIVKSIFQMYEIDFPVHKVLVSRKGYFDYPNVPYGVELIEKRGFEEWFEAMRKNTSPIKHIQLKSAQLLLQYCQTTCVKRPEWGEAE